MDGEGKGAGVGSGPEAISGIVHPKHKISNLYLIYIVVDQAP